ncbi:hypothetical protein F4553_002516 [Allocatelliglobosispora scoriae]|uniref:Secreted protein n=1 Tax=Allocatelliglobosispora scoriae TaxID=643052 RepID=A0A841BJ46_9ACTN|nr:hypothetical protein [Allocatelliglobosispora scoriae]MBB5869137.1 hypothetical protein [Allocatelliglobosispora scoriae]
MTVAAAMAAAATVAVTTLTLTAPAQAASYPCYKISKTSTTANGWCDGNGPYPTYQVETWCYNPTSGNSVTKKGPMKWLGDRNGSSVTCPSDYPVRTGTAQIFVYDSNHLPLYRFDF